MIGPLRVAIRADASPVIGTGHVLRCLALADALQARGAQVTFVSRDLPESLVSEVHAHGHACVPLPRSSTEADIDGPPHRHFLAASWREDAAQTKAVLDDACAVLVVDHYALDARWERALRVDGRCLLVIDDLADRAHDADWLLDQNLHGDAAKRYADRVPVSCQLLLGPRYALLREEFRRVYPPRDIPPRARRLFVFFGGIDAAGATEKTLRALAGQRMFDCVDVVIGAVNPRRAEINALARQVPGATVAAGVDDMAARMRVADLALGAGGTTTWERCATGLPSLVLAVAENQRTVTRDAAMAALHVSLGDAADIDPDHLREALRLLAANMPLRAALSQRAAAAVDGCGAPRVARLLAPARLSLRLASTGDCDAVYQWRNSPQNRRYAHDAAAISLADHRRWFAQMLVEPQRQVFLVAEDAQGPVGVVRYDRIGDAVGWRVSVYLVPTRQGVGLGQDVLRSGTAWLRAHRPDVRVLYAEVRTANEASRRAFLAAGYRAEFETFMLEIGS